MGRFDGKNGNGYQPIVDQTRKVGSPPGKADETELDYWRRIATQRGARMQILCNAMAFTDWQRLCSERPEALDWFDDDGVPRRE